MKMCNVIYEPKGKAKEYADLALNLYNGCTHACNYCYAPVILRKDREQYKSSEIRKDILAKIDKDLQSKTMQEKRNTNVLLCFTTDAYQDIEFSITREVLQMFNRYNQSFQVLTKGGERAIKDFDLYKANDKFAATLTFWDDENILKYESGAASRQSRLNSLIAAKEKGIETWVSFEPVLKPQDVYKFIEETHTYIDLYKIGKLNGFKEIESKIDWKEFALKSIELCEKYNKRYYIKKDLQAFL